MGSASDPRITRVECDPSRPKICLWRARVSIRFAGIRDKSTGILRPPEFASSPSVYRVSIFPFGPIGREGPIRMVGRDESSGTPSVARGPRNHPHPKSGGAADRHRAHADGLGTADVERRRRGRPAG
jgi:hypothetical protein